ncbi:MAG: DPP IV N-terminal domain-containing protein [Alistipes sp.]|nr:DPP IV N-terminal domain-containing protein [Candidatus Alistipes equi]
MTSNLAKEVSHAVIETTKHSIFTLSICLLAILPCMAQQKTFTLEDVIPGGKNYAKYQTENMQLSWWGNQLVKTKRDTCFLYTPKGQWKTLFTLKDIQNQYNMITSLSRMAFATDGKPEVKFIHPAFILSYNWKTKTIIKADELQEDMSHEDYCPASHAIAYNYQNNLYIDVLNGKRKMQVSTDGSHDIVYGQSVHRNEFGIDKGTFWSPDGTQLCFYRMDQSMVPDYPLVDISTRIATIQPTKYPMAGTESHKVSMGIFNLKTQQTVWLQTGDNTDQYYCGITWSPDSKKIYLYNLNRDQNHAKLLQFDANSGKLEKTLFEEHHEKYVQPQHGLTFLPWDNEKFIYWSEKDGYDHLYLYSLKEGQTIRKITDNNLGVIVDLLGFNAKDKSIIVNCTGASPIQHNLYRINLKDCKSTLLGNSTGVHRGFLSADGSLVIDTWTSPTVPRKIDLINTSTGKSSNLLTAADPWKNFNVPEISSGTIKAADDSTDLYYRLIKPINFDKKKKYPAVVYVYGGPHTHLVDASWGYMCRGWELYMASLGYVVYVIDNRGSNERGLAFENVTFRHLGKEEMKDQIKGVEFLKSLTFVDSNRIGVHGWSFGGFMTTNLMLTYPDVFKAGVAGGPVIDWQYYEIMYGERYMDTPQSNPEGYKENNLRLRAGDLKGRLLIIFGYNDPVCVPQHTLSFIRACEDKGTHPDLLTYPGDEHNMIGRDRVHLHEHITRYFEEHLK